MENWGFLQGTACTPDLVTVVNHESGEAVTTEEIRYGLRVAVLILPSAPQMCTPQALQFVGPQAFGLPSDVSYCPIGTFVQQEPVGPL